MDYLVWKLLLRSRELMKISEPNSTTALLIIDVQQGLFQKATPIYRAEEILKNINTLVEKARYAGVLVVYVQHSDNLALIKGTDGWQLHPQLQYQDIDTVIQKEHGNAFEDTNLHEILDVRRVNKLVITGLVTYGCVRATCLGAQKFGYNVTLISDAHSSYHEKAAQLIDEWNQKFLAQKIKLIPTAEVEF